MLVVPYLSSGEIQTLILVVYFFIICLMSVCCACMCSADFEATLKGVKMTQAKKNKQRQQKQRVSHLQGGLCRRRPNILDSL